jgi:hypothetical protein
VYCTIGAHGGVDRIYLFGILSISLDFDASISLLRNIDEDGKID